MRSPRILGLAPLAAVLAAIASSIALFTMAPSVRAACGTASSPCPTPVNAFISLDPTAGDSNTLVNVSGGQFLPNEDMTLYWDQTNHVAGTAHADSNGSFNARVKPIATDSPGVHKLCASVPPNPCANFALQAITPTPSESPSPSPSATESPSPTPTPLVGTLPSGHSGGSGLDIITRPPFVFLPIAGAAAILLALGFWLFSYLRRPKPAAPLTSAAVVHRAMRPDYSAGFGTPPPAAPALPEPSAWNEPVARAPLPPAQPPSQPPAEPASEISNVEWGPAVEWGTGGGDWGFPEPPIEDPEEPPRPTD